METETQSVDPSARVREIFEAFRLHGAPGAATTTTYLFDLHGEDGGRYLLTLSPEGASWQPDYDGDADVTISLAVSDLIAIADGEIDGRFAVSSERIEIAGDMDAALGMLESVDTTGPEE